MSTRNCALSLILLAILVGLAPGSAVAGAKLGWRGDPGLGYHLPAIWGPAGAQRARHGYPSLSVLNAGLGFGSALVGSAPVGDGPSGIAVDAATHTIYVANGYNANGSQVGGDTVSVVDARRCNAHNVLRCRGPWPTIKVGQLPSGVAIDERTDTIYVSNVESDDAPGTVSVIDGATCNARNQTGCGQTPATVPVGYGPGGIFADPANHTVYVPNFGGPFVFPALPVSTTVSMIDSATCNATDLADCPRTTPPTVDVGASPDSGTVDRATHTVYITTIGAQNGWAVFDASTCNATTQSGCGQIGMLPGDPNGPFDAQVDEANQTLYTSNFDNTISAYDLRDCNAADLAGCASVTGGNVTLPPAGFNQDLWLIVDARLQSVYVVYQKDDALVVVNTGVCSGSDPAGCATFTPPEIHTGSDPELIALDPHTQTLYTSDEVDNDVSVIDATRCDARTTSGCRARAPEVPIGSGGLAADTAVDTIYDPSGATNVSMIDDSRCNAFHTGDCLQTPPTVTVGAGPVAVAVDQHTHTVYVANFGAGSTGTVSVFDDRTCNATDQAGCAMVSTLPVPGGHPLGIVINPSNDTIYVATITSDGGSNLISVFNGATCNAAASTGCRQTPATVATGADGGGQSTASVAVDSQTNTIYATSDVTINFAPYIGHIVYVINGATCDAANTTGCGQSPATVSLNSLPSNPFGIRGQQPNPFGIAVDVATDTIYTANIANGEGPGTVSVINGATCNGQDMTGCGQTPATAPAGFGANGIAVDQATNQIFATNIEDTSVTTINGNICTATDTGGCDHTRTRAIVGDYPTAISVDPFVGTAYVADSEGVSVIPLKP